MSIALKLTVILHYIDALSYKSHYMFIVYIMFFSLINKLCMG